MANIEIKNTALPIIFIMGPTASGKTALAIDLIQDSDDEKFEIISVDSAMVFTQLNIGSAKPSLDELAIAPHHLIDFIDPKQSYSALQFCDDAKRLINDIHQRGKTPLLVGGTMLYFKALKEGLSDLPSTDPTVRQQVAKQLDEFGSEFLHRHLEKIDPITAKRLHPNDSQRITRAIEVFNMTNKPISQWHQEQQKKALTNPLLSIALVAQDRKKLHQRIELRFHQMMQQGFLQEVSALYQRGDLNLDCPSMRSVGYRQIWQHLSGEVSKAEAVERGIIATRQLAKRQYTWLRSWPDVQSFDPFEAEEMLLCKRTINQFLSRS